MQINSKDFKIDFHITKEQFKGTIFSLGILLLSVIIGGLYSTYNYGTSQIVLLFVALVWFIVILLLLDYLNIIQFRKTIARKTKCAICGRVRVSGDEEPVEKLVKTVETKTEDQKEVKQEKVHEQKKAVPLEGVIISDKVICSDCVVKIRKITWQE